MNLLQRCILSALIIASAFLTAPLRAEDKNAPKPDPDVIIFTNGDHITGQVERIVGKSLTFKSDMAGEITVDLGKVKELHSNGSYALVRSDAVKKVHFDRASIPTGTVSYADGKITVANPVGEAETIDAGKVAFVIDQPTFDRDVARQARLREGWTGSVTGGATLVLATQNSETFTGAIALQRLVPIVTWLPKANRTTFNLSETYGKVTQAGTPDVLTSIFHTDAENDRYMSTRFYYLGQLSLDHNYSQGLNLAQSYGGGLGWVAVQKPNKELDLKVDLHFLQQEFQPPTTNENLIGSNFTETYKQTLPHKIVLTQGISAIPAWNYETAFSATANAGLVMPVYKRFSMSLTTSDSFLNDPGVGFKRNSFQVVTGISYTLK
jgi:hypothetical protein